MCSSLSGLCREKGEEKANSNVQFSLYFIEKKLKRKLTHYPRHDDILSSSNLFFLMLSAFLQLKSDLAETYWKGAQYPPHTFLTKQGSGIYEFPLQPCRLQLAALKNDLAAYLQCCRLLPKLLILFFFLKTLFACLVYIPYYLRIKF